MVWELSLGAMFEKTRSINFGIGIGIPWVEDVLMLFLETFSVSLKMFRSSVFSWTSLSLTFSGPVALLPSLPSRFRLSSDH